MMNIETVEQALRALPRSVLCTFPTPLERMCRIEAQLNAGPVYIKRDDLNGVGPGGNKVRPLEYLLGQAAASGCDIVIASGQENSNLCSICAAACARLGLSCILVHNNPQPQEYSGNMVLNRLSGAQEHYIGTMPEPERDRYVAELAHALEQAGRPPYIVENGATMPAGSIGYIHLLFELLQNNPTPPISDLFVPGGNGGLAAGVVYGAALLGAPFHVHVITVEHTKEDLERIIRDLISEMEKHLGLVSPMPLSQVMTIHEAYRGDGWGISTPESDRALEHLAKNEGIFLDQTYNAKAFWGMCDLLQSGRVKATASCFLHSGGFASLFWRKNPQEI